jgi:hypothetical protein
MYAVRAKAHPVGEFRCGPRKMRREVIQEINVASRIAIGGGCALIDSADGASATKIKAADDIHLPIARND